MQPWTRVAMGGLLGASAIATAIVVVRSASGTRPPHVTPAPARLTHRSVDPPVAQTVMPPDQAPDPVDIPPQVTASSAHCDVPYLPKSYVHQVGEAATRELAADVNDWIRNGGDNIAIEYRRGVAYVQSAEDRGDDGPYPQSAGAESARVCGSQSVWLRSHLRERLAHQELVCCDNICSYGGMEYAPSGDLVFRQIQVGDQQRWALDAWIEVYSAALGRDIVEENYAYATHALQRLSRTSCPGEPAGAY